jgi:major membrane immunogen (membrane-anchored lipoprotein)
MRSVIMSALGTILLAVTLGATSLAQIGGVPSGSYQQTCRDIRSNAGRLEASCQRRDGSWQQTSLNFQNCQGPIENIDGQLSCTASSGAQGGLPAGDYQQTCRNIRSNGSQLIANCRKQDGSWRNTSLDTLDCRGSIVNDDGQLRCASGGSYGGGWQGGYQAVPPGDYQKTCQNIYIDGSDLVASCQKSDGTWKDTRLKNVNDCGGQIVNHDGNLRCF